MEFHQLRYFLAVAGCGSFTRAAEHEHVAQPSLSQQIRKLEDELGARLFDRLGRRTTLTPFGERFRLHAQRVLAEVEGARQDIQELLGLRRGSVTVGAIPTVAPYVMPKLLTAFARAYPEVSVNVREDLTQSLLTQLSGGEIDVALLSLPIKGGEFESAVLIDEPMLLAVPSRHPLGARRARRVSLPQVVHEPFLLLKEGHCFRSDVLEVCKHSRLNPHVVFEAGQFDTLVAMVAAGAGVTLLPRMACAHYRRSGVRVLEFAPPQPRRTIGYVRAKDKYLTPAARAFIEILKRTWAASRRNP